MPGSVLDTVCLGQGSEQVGDGEVPNKNDGGRKCNVAFVLSFKSHTHGRWGCLEVNKVGKVGGVWNNVDINMFHHKIIPKKN